MRLTTVMYHYVRDLQHSRYPGIKGLDIGAFAYQLKYLKTHYTVLTVEEVVDALGAGGDLPPNAALLTFDDAYLDHYRYVFPLLDEYGLQGSFYPSARSVLEKSVLEVNKIHYLLASGVAARELLRDIFALLDARRADWGLEPNDFYYKKLAVANRFDTAEVVFIKRLLQRELPGPLRKELADTLLHKHIGISEAVLHEELYASFAQLQLMHRRKMHIGVHGYDHFWLGYLTKPEVENEIDKSLAFLEKLRGAALPWTMAYPFGNYSETVIEVVRDKGCSLAFTTEPEVATLSLESRFAVSRFDTNDFPKRD